MSRACSRRIAARIRAVRAYQRKHGPIGRDAAGKALRQQIIAEVVAAADADIRAARAARKAAA